MDKQTKRIAIDSFVCREIAVCQTALIEEALKKHLFTVDDIYNLYREFDGQLLTPNKCVTCHNTFRCLDSHTGTCLSCFEDNQTPQEIFEWWVVSPWIAKKLLLAGEPVIDNEFGQWWGRTTTGQAIALDEVIEELYDAVMS